MNYRRSWRRTASVFAHQWNHSTDSDVRRRLPSVLAGRDGHEDLPARCPSEIRRPDTHCEAAVGWSQCSRAVLSIPSRQKTWCNSFAIVVPD
jgi:hypothetical protein